MNIYKYGVNQEKVIYVVECSVLQKKPSTRDGRLVYEIMEEVGPNRRLRKWIYADDLEVYSSKVMYSASGDKKMEFIKRLKEAYENTIDSYLKKAEDSRNNLGEILKVNNLI